MEGSYDFDSEEEEEEEEEEGEQEEREQIAEHEEPGQEDETQEWRRGRFTPAQEEELAQWFCDNPCFYDQSQRFHFNRAKRDKMMQDKARSMGLNASKLQTWWNTMRTRYGKLRGTVGKSSSGGRKPTPRQAWVVRRFSFLESYLQVRSASARHALAPRQKPAAEAAATEEEEEEEEVAPPEQPASSSSAASTPAQATPGTFPGSAHRRGAQAMSRSSEEAMAEMSSRMVVLMPLQDQMKQFMTDARNKKVSFCSWVANELEPLDDAAWSTCCQEIFAVVMRHRDSFMKGQVSQQFRQAAPQQFQQAAPPQQFQHAPPQQFQQATPQQFQQAAAPQQLQQAPPQQLQQAAAPQQFQQVPPPQQFQQAAAPQQLQQAAAPQQFSQPQPFLAQLGSQPGSQQHVFSATSLGNISLDLDGSFLSSQTDPLDAPARSSMPWKQKKDKRGKKRGGH
ncbi:uncharacterized protein LOC126986088 [Eriocheir sinensis]|uniref:uncharacterized protein LOC126986088 n=1 Tax=Eriocheir sinensis TaxID=95602 RepID=UPI0021C89972|nr:uncharacterized protein LOC126986088 [Eriocheir sinensis]